MKTASQVKLSDIQAVYSGFEGKLWELIMGEQIHIGGLTSSLDLAETAGIGEGMSGVDFCCCSGAGMRFLSRFRKVASMTGVDATATQIELGRARSAGLPHTFMVSDVCENGLPGASADFIWGEDAWCYVADKSKLIAEAARIVKPGGVIAFTDWVEGSPMTDTEAARFLAFMKFPTFANLDDYKKLLEANGCEIVAARNTERFAPCVDLYLNMLGQQLTYDALKIVGFDNAIMEMLGGEMQNTQKLAHEGKVIQGLFVARKK